MLATRFYVCSIVSYSAVLYKTMYYYMELCGTCFKGKGKGKVICLSVSLSLCLSVSLSLCLSFSLSLCLSVSVFLSLCLSVSPSLCFSSSSSVLPCKPVVQEEPIGHREKPPGVAKETMSPCQRSRMSREGLTVRRATP